MPKQICNWQEIRLHQYLLQATQLEVAKILSQCFGQHLLHLGPTPADYWLSTSPIKHQYCLVREAVATQHHIQYIIGDYHELPLLTDSVDAVVCNHILDLEAQTTHILRELWRVLMPSGRALIIGYNSESWFRLPSGAKDHAAETELLSTQKLRQYLLQFGFNITQFKTFFFRPMLSSNIAMQRLKFLESIGRLFCPYSGSLYLFLVEKPILPITPVRLRWREQALIEPHGIAQPTAMRAESAETLDKGDDANVSA